MERVAALLQVSCSMHVQECQVTLHFVVSAALICKVAFPLRRFQLAHVGSSKFHEKRHPASTW
jgi:hypothetical protein